jgi:hypothetical protein
MGTLKPGVKYIYERQGGTVYAREFGADPNTRKVIGYDWELDNNPARVKGASLNDIKENQLWHDIRIAATDNPALQDLLERAKVLYYMSKEHGDSKT